MGKFWIYYSTAVLIEAETAEEAERLFLTDNYDDSNRAAEVRIDGIEEIENNIRIENAEFDTYEDYRRALDNLYI